MIQIDMEMPKNCLDCNLRYQSFCSVDGHHEPHLEKERCPLKVTPQEPRCKDCKWWKDSDGEYRRGCGAESQCPINRREVFEGNGYCYMFSPKSDMREVEE